MKIQRWLRENLDHGGSDLLAIRLYERAFIGTSPLNFVTPAANLYWRLAPSYYRWKFGQNLRQYEYPPDPFKILWVCPDQIEKYTGRQFPPWEHREYHFGRVENGEWDRQDPRDNPKAAQSASIADRFSNSVLYQSFKNHFRSGMPWEETELYQRVRDRIDNESYDWPTSERDLRERYESLDALYEEIIKNGYMTQMDLRKQSDTVDPGFNNSGDPKGFLERFSHEIAVDIGRDGELLFVDGRHRLAIAKVAEIPQVPIVVLVRHEKWMENRNRAGRKKKVTSHPDLDDL
ncbi:hypothetical protein [Halorhabdus salina]|uniref:hypothetical protein n=1 Tax=Halorhabdus salina TaxID=2750670 RepID=UPI0015EEDC14|nr:hypothetical protein [Halorhabdus salina]